MREEIALAKAEMTEKVSGLVKGAAVGAAAGIFIVAGLIYFLHFLALLIAELLGDTWWLGYLIVAGALFLFGGLAGFLAARFFKKGTPPTPQMAIEEAQLIKATLTAPHPATPGRRRRAGEPGEGRGAMSAQRSPEEIRRSIEANRAELGVAVEKLRGEVVEGDRLARAAARAQARGDHRRGRHRVRRSAAGSPRSPACSPAAAAPGYY